MSWDRRISLALILAVLAQAAGAFLWAGAAGERVTQLERRVDDLSAVNERLARLEVQIAAARVQLDRIESRLDQPA